MKIVNENAIVIFIVSLMMLYYYKPTMLFIKDGAGYKLREYGVGYDEDENKRTLFNMQNIILILAIFSYIIGDRITDIHL